MGAAALPIISGVGVLGGLLQGRSANRQAKKQLSLEQQATQSQLATAGQQQQLYGQTAPVYENLIRALAGISGLGPSPGGYPGSVQLPYTNVTPGQLGNYANPTDALRLRASEDYSRAQTGQAMHGLNFGL